MDGKEMGKTASEDAPRRRQTAWWAEILIAIAAVLVVVGIAIPAYNTAKTYARRGEGKKNLHEIQLAVERYATDAVMDGGFYPEFLLGGSAPGQDDPRLNLAQASDPLIRKGYLTVYPRNPFAVPENVRAMQEKYNDPFRPGTEQSKFGMRFGEDYALMGQVLADFRYPKLPGQKMTKVNNLFCYADTEYPFWDIWPEGTKKPKPFLPGEFFYKSWDLLEYASEEAVPKNTILVPIIPEIYMLGLYGGPTDRGLDVIGEEPLLTFRYKAKGKDEYVEFSVPIWTRSTLTPDAKGDFQGSTFGYSRVGEGDVEGAAYGSLNGICDAIVLTLVPGEDTKGARE